MQGRRREAPQGCANFPDAMQPGDYWRDRDGCWWAMVPTGDIGAMPNHDVVEHEDGTITVSPSILMAGEHGTYHGFLERGIWRAC